MEKSRTWWFVGNGNGGFISGRDGMPKEYDRIVDAMKDCIEHNATCWSKDEYYKVIRL